MLQELNISDISRFPIKLVSASQYGKHVRESAMGSGQYFEAFDLTGRSTLLILEDGQLYRLRKETIDGNV